MSVTAPSRAEISGAATRAAERRLPLPCGRSWPTGSGRVAPWPRVVPSVRGWWLATALCLPLLGAGQAGSGVVPGIDVWREEGFAPFAGARVGLITNVTGRAADSTPTYEILRRDGRVRLGAIFTPEHGLSARAEGAVRQGRDTLEGVPIFSLYGSTPRPTAAMLRNLDLLVFDIQDVGSRYYTYATTLAYAMEEAAARGLPVVVLDRPNPVNGVAVAGPVLEPGLRSFVGYAEIATRHGMTIGELARFINEEYRIGAQLQVVPMRGWSRRMWFDETGLEWIDPSPNIRNPTQALLYTVLGAIERTNLSVGRGTDEPFEWFGAPWLDGRALAALLNAADTPGVRFVARRRTPRSGPYAGEQCSGVQLLVVDRDAFDSGLTAATIVTALHRLHPTQWDAEPLPPQWGEGEILEQLARGDTPAAIVASWRPRLERFLARRARALLYR